MIEIDIVKIVIDVLIVFPLLMAILLHIDYKVDGKYDVEFEITEFEDLNIENDVMIRFIKKVKEVVCKHE